METQLRKADLATLAERLESLHKMKVDAVVPASKLAINSDGDLVVGVEVADMTRNFERQIADRLNIPLKYADRMRGEQPQLYADNVNTWLRADDRQFLVRTYKNGRMEARALLSNSYNMIDNIEVLYTMLTVVKGMGIECRVLQSDLTERSMYLKVEAPGIRVDGGPIIEQYARRFGAAHTRPDLLDPNGVTGGIVARNSETGHAAFSLAPRITLKVCINGLVIEEDSLRRVHVGQKLDEGVIDWSERTRKANRELIAAQTEDAVRQFLSTDYVEAKVIALNEQGGHEVEHPVECITNLCNDLSLSEERRKAILNEFIQVGDLTAFGATQAITAYAQSEADADVANDLEGVVVTTLPKIARFDVDKIITN